jgi:hypothetical protein
LHLSSCFSFDTLCKKGCGGFRDTASRTQEADVPDNLTVKSQKELKLVTTKRVSALSGASHMGELMEIPRVLAMVENHLLI